MPDTKKVRTKINDFGASVGEVVELEANEADRLLQMGYVEEVGQQAKAKATVVPDDAPVVTAERKK